MSDVLEHDLREALTDRAARITPEASARLRTVDYHPRSRWRPTRPVLGTLGVTGVAAAVGAAILLGSSAAPAFAGWTANPTTLRPGQLAAAEQQCGTSGTPVLADARGPYTALIYADGSTCVTGNGITINSNRGEAGPTPQAGKVGLNGAGESDSNGNSLTMVDGPIGAGVSGVTIARSDGSSVQATVENGWYLAWWPGTEHAVAAQVAGANGTSTQSFPSAPKAPNGCPAGGGQCQSGYGFGSAPGHGGGQMTIRGDQGGSASGSSGGSASGGLGGGGPLGGSSGQ
jgi:hypothetical protein